MKKNIIIKGAMSLFLAGSMASCASDYLDTEPQMGIDAGLITATVDNARKAMYGVCRGMYNQWQSMDQGFNGEAFITNFYGEIPSQDQFQYYWAQWNGHMNLDWAGVRNYKMCNFAWTYAYTLIGQANDILAGIDNAEGLEAERNYVKAQTLTLRAHSYFRLLQVYAPRWEDSNDGATKCIVLRTTPTTGDTPLVSMKEVLDQIYADLNTAIDLFSKAPGVKRTNIWEPNLEICYGIYSRVALLKHDWALAQEMANKARQGYPIMSADEYQLGFSQPNAEWMWASSGELVDEIYYWAHGVYYACNGHLACSYDYGAGSINIDLYRQIPENDIRRNLFLTGDKVPSFNDEKWYNPDFINEVSISLKNDPINTRSKAQIQGWARSLPPVAENGYRYPYELPEDAEDGAAGPIYAYGAQFKYWCVDDRGRGYVNFMRGAEMLLNEAEAAYHNGNEGVAKACLEELNKNRQEGYVCDKAGQALLDEIRLYRRIELWGEGFNWYDFKRWNLPIERRAWVANDPTSGNFPIVNSFVVEPTKANGWRFAIPESETNYNDAINLAELGY